MTDLIDRIMCGNKWDKIWMDLAHAIAKNSTCNIPDRSVGCVIVAGDNSQVLSLGYNGSAKGDDNSCEYAPTTATGGLITVGSRCTCVHAEMNALTKLNTTNLVYKKMYLTLSPCNICYKLIVNAGINEVIYAQEYSRGNSLEKLKDLGVYVRHIKGHYK